MGVAELRYVVRDDGNLFAQASVFIEVIETNDAPVIADASFSIAERSAAGTPVGVLTATDKEGDPISGWDILGGAPDLDGDGVGAFAIDAATGAISVADADDLDFEELSTFELSVVTTDGALASAPANVTITITDIFDDPVNLDLNPLSTNPDNAPDEESLFALYEQRYSFFAQALFRSTLNRLDEPDRDPTEPLITPGSSSPDELTVVGDQLFFPAFDGVDRELFRLDHPTGEVTKIDIHPTANSNPIALTSFDGDLFFSANDGTDRDLWRYDVETDTLLKIDLNPGGGSFPLFFTEHQGSLWFAATGPDGTRQLWRLDPGAATPFEVRVDAVLQPDNPVVRSDPQGLVSFNGELYFQNGTPFANPSTASDGSLWRVDPTGPTRLDGPPPPAPSGEEFELAFTNVHLLFGTSDGEAEIDGTRYFVDFQDGQRELFVDPIAPDNDIGAPLELSEIQRSFDLRGFVVNGEAEGDRFGGAIGGAGDVNGDGFDDVVFASFLGSPSAPAAGVSYVVFGKEDGAAVEASEIAAGTGGFAIVGAQAGDGSGRSVASAGDVNGDGLGDLIIGAREADLSGDVSGGSYVVFGKSDTAPVNLSDIETGLGGFAIAGAGPGDRSGGSVSSVGDLNGDGLDDLVVGALFDDPNGQASGAAYVVFGKADGAGVSLLDVGAGIGGFAINGAETFDQAGLSVSGAGDVNGDGVNDLIVGSLAEAPGLIANGRSYVVFGKADGTPIELSALDNGAGGFLIDGASAYDRAGFTVSQAGDVNGDGLADVIVGASDAEPGGVTGAGSAYVVFGKADASPVDLNLVEAGIGGFAINGGLGFLDAGRAVGGAGDVNGDGLDDVIVNALEGFNVDAPGSALVVFGKSDGAAVELTDVSTGVGGFHIVGAAPNDFAGFTVAGAGDVNGDGFDDLMTSAIFADPNGNASGAGYVIYGGDFTGAATQVGGPGADNLTGVLGNDVIIAGAGDDTIVGNGATDRLTGGQGDDRFVFAPVFENATVVDFEDGPGGQDVIDLSAFNFADAADVLSRASGGGIGGDDVVIFLDPDNLVILENVNLADLDATDFIL